MKLQVLVCRREFEHAGLSFDLIFIRSLPDLEKLKCPMHHSRLLYTVQYCHPETIALDTIDR